MADATGVSVTNPMPAGLSFVSAAASQGSFASDGQNVVFSLGTVPVGSNATMTVSFNVPGAGSITNTATVGADQSDPDPSNNSAKRVVTAIIDTGLPTLLTATALADGQTIQLTFSESVAPDTATNTDNYLLDTGRGDTLSITGARVGTSSSIVLLTTHLLDGLTPLEVSVSNITDCRGHGIEPAPALTVTLPPFDLIAAGAVWKYLDDGSNQGTAWRSNSFNDSLWGAGPAQLGYGDGDEMTELDYGPDANNKFTTYYFRHPFIVSDAFAITNLTVSLLRDDGGIVYLNGVEIFRSNMPAGTVSYTSSAASVASDDGTIFFSTNANAALLVSGTNVLAVEIHQANLTSSDISFDLELTGRLGGPRRPLITAQPQSQRALPGTNVTFSAGVSGTAVLAYQWRMNATDLAGATNASMIVTNVSAHDGGAYTLVVTNSAGSITSSVANLTVLIKPSIVSQPQSQTIVAGDDVTFTVTVTNGATLPVTYRWRKDGVYQMTNILSQYSASLTLTNVQPGQAGDYTVAITNLAGPVPLSSAATLTVLADTDGDHIPDDWELAYGLNPTDSADAAEDPDGDGMTNLQEYIAGTDPTNGLSYLKIDGIQLNGSSTDLQINFSAVSNRSYSIQWRDAADTGSWSNVLGIAARTTNWPVSVTNQVPPSATSRFFRLVTPQQ